MIDEIVLYTILFLYDDIEKEFVKERNTNEDNIDDLFDTVKDDSY